MNHHTLMLPGNKHRRKLHHIWGERLFFHCMKWQQKGTSWNRENNQIEETL
jgi:hypothetical protein